MIQKRRSNRGIRSRFIRLQVVLLLTTVLSAPGCSGPSEITVTNFRGSHSETGSERDAGRADDGILSARQAMSFETDDAASGGEGEGTLRETAAQASAGGLSDHSGTSSPIGVYVCGAVKKPGVCYLPEGARVCDALEEAGGFTVNADSEWLNQAKILSDGEMLIVYTQEETAQMKEQGIPRGGAAPEDAVLTDQLSASASGQRNSGRGFTGQDESGQGSSVQGTGGPGPVNLNTASKEQLMTLPGIGEAKADAIIRYRTEQGFFASPEDVMNISGIKNSIYDKIRGLITV